ncbi:MAG: DUF433 domain-containing protein [Dehalococcoidia bacterium]
MAAVQVELGVRIEQDPDWHSGWPYVAGTRKTVAAVAILYSQGLNVEAVAAEKSMTLPQVLAALAYYFAHREQIDAQIDEAEALYDKLAAA